MDFKQKPYSMTKMYFGKNYAGIIITHIATVFRAQNFFTIRFFEFEIRSYNSGSCWILIQLLTQTDGKSCLKTGGFLQRFTRCQSPSDNFGPKNSRTFD